MATKHPYVVGTGGLTKTLAHFRKSFPATVNAATLTKLGFAPNNESYVVNTIRFLGLIDEGGGKTKEAGTVFSQHADSDFQAGFSDIVKKAYSDLFNLHSESAWTLSTDQLIAYFRGSDESSAIVGQRQATTFQALAAMAGKAAPVTNANKTKTATKTAAQRPAKPRANSIKSAVPPDITPPDHSRTRDLGLTVRIEVNLPAVADQATYDAIFSSIRKNLIDVG